MSAVAAFFVGFVVGVVGLAVALVIAGDE